MEKCSEEKKNLHDKADFQILMFFLDINIYSGGWDGKQMRIFLLKMKGICNLRFRRWDWDESVASNQS